MLNSQQFHAKRIAPLRDLEVRFKSAGEIIRRHRPGETIGDFPSLDGTDAMHHGDFGVLEVQCELSVNLIQRRADELQAQAEEAERDRAERQRQQNMTPLEAKVEKLERAVAYLAGEFAKSNGLQQGRLPALPHTPRAEVPQFLGMPRGMGRHGIAGPSGGGGGVRKLGTNGTPIVDAPAESGFTRRQHPLEVIGSSGVRGR